jgi:DNA invertase Pin-like site-specific DNA recombinase
MSTDTQLKGDSLRRQLDASKAYAEKNGLELVESFEGKSLQDIGVSGFRGKNTKKGVLANFLDSVELGKIEPNSVFLIESLDRLTRNSLSEALPLFMSILNKDIEIITLADNQKYTKEIINNNPGAMFVSLGIMFRANEESEIKSKRLKSAWSNKRNNLASKVLTRTCPAWLTYSEKTGQFEIDEKKGEVVKKIFDLCISACGIFSIARYLNENKIPVFGKGRLWYISYIKKIIDNRAVVGEFIPHMMIDGKRVKSGEAISGYFPSVISEEKYIQAQLAIAHRSKLGKGRKGKTFSNLFAGITYCGECGFKIMVRSHGNNLKNSKYLNCSNNIHKGGCNMSPWNLKDFEKITLTHLREIDFSEMIQKSDEKKGLSLTEEFEVLEAKIKNIKEKINKANDLILEPMLNESAKLLMIENLNSLSDEFLDLSEKLKEKNLEIQKESADKNQLTEKEFKSFLKQLEENSEDYLYRSSLNLLLTKLIEKIELKNDYKEIMPWEFDDSDEEIIAYRSAYEGRKDKPLSQLLTNSDFKNFIQNYHRKIIIKYRSGIVRHLFVGKNASIPVEAYT